MWPLFFIPARLLTTCVLAFALMAVGFAHRYDASATSPEMVDYVAAGGSLSDLCGDFDGSGRSGTVHCEACRIVETVSLAQCCALLPVVTVGKVEVFRFAAKRLRQSRGLDPARLTRAPPQA